MCQSQAPTSFHPAHFPPWYPCSFSSSVFLFLLCKYDRLDWLFLAEEAAALLSSPSPFPRPFSSSLLRVEGVSSLHSVFRCVPLPCFQVQGLSIQFFMKSQMKGIVKGILCLESSPGCPSNLEWTLHPLPQPAHPSNLTPIPAPTSSYSPYIWPPWSSYNPLLFLPQSFELALSSLGFCFSDVRFFSYFNS